jgi:hypothetical protein
LEEVRAVLAASNRLLQRAAGGELRNRRRRDVHLLAGVLALRRHSARRRDRVDVYFADGSMVSLADGTPGASTVLPLARRILETTRN